MYMYMDLLNEEHNIYTIHVHVDMSNTLTIIKYVNLF